MSYQDSIMLVAQDAVRYVQDGNTIGLGSGRAAAALVAELGHIPNIRGVPTSMQIRLAAEAAGIPMLDPGGVAGMDIVFDGADQIDANGYMIKGGGGALLLERVLAGMADVLVIIADETKFVERLCMPIPLEVHPAARSFVSANILGIGAEPQLRVLERGYPAFTENGNIILDCNFGMIEDPPELAGNLRKMPGVLEVGIFERPDVIYRAALGGSFDVLKPLS